MDQKEGVRRFEAAAAVLPNRLRKKAMMLETKQKAQAREIRLRVGRAMTVLLPEGELSLAETVTAEDLEIVCDLACDFSRYASMETLRQGFLPTKGGLRVGLCGTVVMKNGQAANIKDISSAAIRIEREKKGVAAPILPELVKKGFRSTLILSPPGGGKTTLLRDLVRMLSDEYAYRVALIDERGEIAVTYRGTAQMDVGKHTDVLDQCPKGIGIPMVLRAMNPQIIALDEITAKGDLAAIEEAVGCGVSLLATIHGSSVEDLRRKPLYQEIMQQQIFEYAISITQSEGEHCYTVECLT